MTRAARPRVALAPLATGLALAGLGYIVALAQGMSSAPSGWAGVIGTGMFLLGCALAVCGLASIWVPGLRSTTRLATRLVLIGIVAAIVIERVIVLVTQ